MILGVVDRLRLARTTASQLIKSSIMDVGTIAFLFLHDVTCEKRGFS